MVASPMAIQPQVVGFEPVSRSKTVGEWARMNATDPLVATW